MNYQRLFWMLLLISAMGCTTHIRPKPEMKTELVIDPSTPREALAPWLFYAGARAYWMEKKFFEQHPGVTVYQYTFAEELAARDYCAMMWEEIIAKEKQVNRYLDDLLIVRKAGFLREYTWTYFRDGNWPEPENLRLAQFDQWRRVNLSGHEPATRAVARFQGR